MTSSQEKHLALSIQVVGLLAKNKPRLEISRQLGIPVADVDLIAEQARTGGLKTVTPKMTREQARKRGEAIAEFVRDFKGDRTRAVEAASAKWGVSLSKVFSDCKSRGVATGKIQKPAMSAVQFYKVAAMLLRGESQSEVARKFELSRERVSQLKQYMEGAGLVSAVEQVPAITAALLRFKQEFTMDAAVAAARKVVKGVNREFVESVLNDLVRAEEVEVTKKKGDEKVWYRGDLIQ